MSSAEFSFAYDELKNLLVEVVHEQFGPDAAAIVEVLYNHGPSTLFAVYQNWPAVSTAASLGGGRGGIDDNGDNGASGGSAVRGDSPSLALQGSVKIAMATLVHHTIVRHDEEKGTYTVMLGYALLLRGPIGYLTFSLLRRRYRDAGGLLACVMVEHGPLPARAILSAASERQPSLHSALEATWSDMQRDGIVAVRSRVSKEDATMGLDLWYLEGGAVLHVLRKDAVMSYFRSKEQAAAASTLVEPDLQSSIALTLAEHDTSVPKPWSLSTRRPHGGMPHLSSLGSNVSVRLIRDAFPSTIDELTFSAALSQSCSSSTGFVHRSDDAASYRLHYGRLFEHLADDACDSMTFARYGIGGVRVVKILRKHGFAEDRVIADESFQTLAQVRDLLGNMMLEGYVQQQEVPRGPPGIPMERQPKQSLFLWTLSTAAYRSAVTSRTAKALRIAMLRRKAEEQQHQTLSTPSEGRNSSTTGKPSAAILKLQYSILSLSRQLVILGYL